MVRNRSDGDYWIGLNDIQFEGSFKWVSPNSTPLFTDWGHRNEPNNSFGNEDCVVLSQRYKYEWNDRDCNTTAHFICGK